MEEDYKNNIGFLIHDVARLMRNLFDKRMSELGLTRSQWWVLNYLYFNEGINQSDFSKLLDLENMKDVKYLNTTTEKDFKNENILYDVFSSLREKINAPSKNRSK